MLRECDTWEEWGPKGWGFLPSFGLSTSCGSSASPSVDCSHIEDGGRSPTGQ